MSFSIPGGKGGMGGRGQYCKRQTRSGRTSSRSYCTDKGVGRRAASGPQGAAMTENQGQVR